VLAIVLICICILFVLGFLEKRKNENNIKKIPIRVNVNGIRGKSTATRLITGILTEAGYKTIGKTTGTAARMIYWNQKNEKPIVRGLLGPNIKEQLDVIEEAAQLGAEALVGECMAVHPDYQEVYQNSMIQANVCVIVNVLEDHLDVMGPTLDQVAMAFTSTIPRGGHLITVSGPYLEYFREDARKKNTKVIVADNNNIPEGFLEKFDYTLFPDNVALALGVAEALGISKEIALQGCLNAHPDPGAVRFHHLKFMGNKGVFINGFAANEPVSSLSIWQKICENKSLPTKNPIILFNGRPDRVDRTEQFVRDFFPHFNEGTLIGMGQALKSIQVGFDKGQYGFNEYIHFEDKTAEEVVEYLLNNMDNRVILGVGNIHGDGEELLEGLLDFEMNTNKQVNEVNALPITPTTSSSFSFLFFAKKIRGNKPKVVVEGKQPLSKFKRKTI